MLFKFPKNTKEYYWTEHSVFKMKCYNLSAQKILNVIKKPERKEEGIVKNTMAVMQPVNPKIINGKKTWKQEVWAMYQLRNSEIVYKSQIPNPNKILNLKLKNYKPQTANQKIKIISAWRYPGVSSKKNPIPEDVLAEIKGLL
jgi:hypothetical protein